MCTKYLKAFFLIPLTFIFLSQYLYSNKLESNPKETKKSTFIVLNLAPGFGVGSAIQGDKKAFALGFVLSSAAWSSFAAGFVLNRYGVRKRNNTLRNAGNVFVASFVGFYLSNFVFSLIRVLRYKNEVSTNAYKQMDKRYLYSLLKRP